MATQPKSKTAAEYRRRIGAYLVRVREVKGWKLVKMGEMAGGLKHTTISRAIKGENTLSYPALLALETNSGVVIPDELRGAAIAAQQGQFGPTLADIHQVAQDIRATSPEFQRALIEELQRNLAKTG